MKDPISCRTCGRNNRPVSRPYVEHRAPGNDILCKTTLSIDLHCEPCLTAKGLPVGAIPFYTSDADRDSVNQILSE